jgi:hypothetical protein
MYPIMILGLLIPQPRNITERNDSMGSVNGLK